MAGDENATSSDHSGQLLRPAPDQEPFLCPIICSMLAINTWLVFTTSGPQASWSFQSLWAVLAVCFSRSVNYYHRMTGLSLETFRFYYSCIFFSWCPCVRCFGFLTFVSLFFFFFLLWISSWCLQQVEVYVKYLHSASLQVIMLLSGSLPCFVFLFWLFFSCTVGRNPVSEFPFLVPCCWGFNRFQTSETEKAKSLSFFFFLNRLSAFTKVFPKPVQTRRHGVRGRFVFLFFIAPPFAVGALWFWKLIWIY